MAKSNTAVNLTAPDGASGYLERWAKQSQNTMTSKLLLPSLQAIIAIVPIIILSSGLALVQAGEDAALRLVEPQIPNSVTVHREGYIGKGNIKAKNGHIVSFELHEGNIDWIYKLTWQDDRLMSIKKTGQNPVLDRKLDTFISIQYHADGRLASQEVYTEGIKRYSLRYKYGSRRVPTGATTYINGRAVETLEYKYEHTAWIHPLYLYNGFHFGAVKTYSTWHGNRFLFASSEYDPKNWAIKSSTIYETEYYPGENWEFNYLDKASEKSRSEK